MTRFFILSEHAYSTRAKTSADPRMACRPPLEPGDVSCTAANCNAELLLPDHQLLPTSEVVTTICLERNGGGWYPIRQMELHPYKHERHAHIEGSLSRLSFSNSVVAEFELSGKFRRTGLQRSI